MADVSKLLYAPTAAPHLLRNLDADAASLIDARRKIRQCLRDAFASSSAAVFGRKVSPRFFTQGSHAYKTMNAPAWVPPQQKDLDDGCYLPLSFVRGARPSQAAKLFFTFVDAALKTLARQEGWRHKEKPTCVRLEISSGAHVDIPLYAIPDAEFVTLQSRMATKAMKDEAKVSPDTWESLPSDAVLLAHREEDWMQSDPRKIHEWFIDAVDNVHGESLRRDSRFLKAWRDHHRLDESHLSSILLMVCVWREYERLGESLDEREDKRLLQVVERLPIHLNGPVQNPACDNDEDINRMSPEERRRVVGAAQNLCGHLRTIINSCSDQARAIELLRAAFGDRVPYRPDLVIVGGATLTVLSTPRTPVAAPEVGRSKTG